MAEEHRSERTHYRKVGVDEDVVRPVDADVVDVVLTIAYRHHSIDDPSRVGGQRGFGCLVGGGPADDRSVLVRRRRCLFDGHLLTR